MINELWESEVTEERMGVMFVDSVAQVADGPRASVVGPNGAGPGGVWCVDMFQSMSRPEPVSASLGIEPEWRGGG